MIDITVAEMKKILDKFDNDTTIRTNNDIYIGCCQIQFRQENKNSPIKYRILNGITDKTNMEKFEVL